MTNFLGVDLVNDNYVNESRNKNYSRGHHPRRRSSRVTGDGISTDPQLVHHDAGRSDDIAGGAGAFADPSTFYENVGANGPYISGVRKAHSVANPWIALSDGWDISILRSRDEISSRGRLTYFYNVFNNVFGAICDVQGAPTITLDTPNNNDGRLFNSMSLRNNPMKSGSALVDFAVAKRERVKIQIFDVSGRVVRTLADRCSRPVPQADVGRRDTRIVRWLAVCTSSVPHADSKFSGKSKLSFEVSSP